MTKCYNFASFLQAKRIRRRRRRHINLDSERPPLGRPQRAAWRRTLELLLFPPHSLFSTHLCANPTLWWGRCSRPASEAAIAKTQHNKQTNKRLSLHPPSVTASHYFLLLPASPTTTKWGSYNAHLRTSAVPYLSVCFSSLLYLFLLPPLPLPLRLQLLPPSLARLAFWLNLEESGYENLHLFGFFPRLLFLTISLCILILSRCYLLGVPFTIFPSSYTFCGPSFCSPNFLLHSVYILYHPLHVLIG